jgi:hypothetical protein
MGHHPSYERQVTGGVRERGGEKEAEEFKANAVNEVAAERDGGIVA